jgi:hypothetical protein
MQELINSLIHEFTVRQLIAHTTPGAPTPTA